MPATNPNTVAKNPEVEHVSSKMVDSCVHKHGSVKGGIGGNRVMNKLAGNEGMVFIKHARADR